MSAGAPGAVLRFVGVGLGPGDPALLTLAAVRELRAADVILVPQTERAGGDIGRAERIILTACPEVADRVRRVAFAMREPGATAKAVDRDEPSTLHEPDHPPGATSAARPGTRSAARHAAAEAALACYDDGATAVIMATVGDPSVYSTFSYLAGHVRRRRADVRIDVVPGITAMQATAAALGVPLVEGDETLTLVPATAGLHVLDQALRGSGGTVVAYKGGRQMPQVRELLKRAERLDDAWLGIDVGLASQRLTTLTDAGPGGAVAPYFSTLLVPARSRISRSVSAHE